MHPQIFYWLLATAWLIVTTIPVLISALLPKVPRSIYVHSCEKLKHHFFEVSFQNERKGCFDAALALVAARILYLMILRFFELSDCLL